MATLEVKDWKLVFNYEGEVGNPISDVNVSGNNAAGAYINFLKSTSQTNINFTGSDYDAEVVEAINVEVADIVSAQ
ncbi:hypothetical protein [Pedobacter antarcticus]|uniref:hypothetical protein n=1 Tax=Pedobacter antarcticus TaxID=34086 RepID=UPI001C59F8B1|nr:hypothetical protein [Pedobacter antarcticus]